MANRGKRGGAASSLSNSGSTPSAASPTSHAAPTAPAVPTAAAPTPPASVWGKGGFNPLTSPASHTSAANGVAATDKSKDKAALTASSTSSSNTATTAAASHAAPPPAAATTTAALPTTATTAPPSSGASTAAPAASASPATTAATSLTPTPVSSLATICQLGNTVHVTTPLGEQLEGVVYVYDAAAHILALEVTTPPHTPTTGSTRDYTLLNTHNLLLTLVHQPATPAPRRHLPPLDPAKLTQRETKALTARSAEAAKIGHNVTATAQRLFDALGKLYEARWDGSAIVLLGVLRLEAPYGGEQLTGGSVQQRQRIVKTIEAQREKEERK